MPRYAVMPPPPSPTYIKACMFKIWILMQKMSHFSGEEDRVRMARVGVAHVAARSRPLERVPAEEGDDARPGVAQSAVAQSAVEHTRRRQLDTGERERYVHAVYAPRGGRTPQRAQ